MPNTDNHELQMQVQGLINKSTEIVKEASAIQDKNAQLEAALIEANREREAVNEKVGQLIPTVLKNLANNGWITKDAEQLDKAAQYLADPVGTLQLMSALSTRRPHQGNGYDMGEPVTKAASYNDSQDGYSAADMKYFESLGIDVNNF